LLVFGRLSHHVGRRPVAITSLLVLVAGCLVLLDVHHIAVLIAGRALMGVGAGLASSSLTSYIVDAAPARPAPLRGPGRRHLYARVGSTTVRSTARDG
jgi:MFS family permease